MNKTDQAIQALERLIPAGERRLAREVISELACMGLRPGGPVSAVTVARRGLGIRSVAEHPRSGGIVWWWERDAEMPGRYRFLAPRN